jgi:hypothetical protein
VAAHRVAQPETQAAEQHQAEKKAKQQHRAKRHFGVRPALDRLSLFLVKNFVH